MCVCVFLLFGMKVDVDDGRAEWGNVNYGKKGLERLELSRLKTGET